MMRRALKRALRRREPWVADRAAVFGLKAEVRSASDLKWTYVTGALSRYPGIALTTGNSI